VERTGENVLANHDHHARAPFTTTLEGVMATYTWADLHIPEAKLLADLTGIQADLTRARETADQLNKLMSSEKPDWSLVEPLSIAVAVAYSRPFMSGVRTSLKDEDLSMLSREQREAHDHLRAYRDKHVAHSVNAFENNQPRAQYCAERVKEEGILSVGCSHGRVSSLSSSDIVNVAQLTEILLKHVEDRIKGEQQRLLQIVRKMPLDKVLAGGQGAFQIDHTTPVDRARKR
jgi:hypothetical protein